MICVIVGEFGLESMFKVEIAETCCRLMSRGGSDASLSRLVVGVVLKAPSAILMLELWIVFRLFRVDILADAYREDP